MNTLNSVISALFEAVSEEKIWDFIRRCEWTRDHDYNRIQHKMLRTLTTGEVVGYQDTYSNVLNKLSVKLDNVVSGVGDDGYSDLLAHIVWSGKELYDAVMSDTSIAQKIIDDREYVESFSYAFPYVSDWNMLDKDYWIERAKRAIEELSDPDYVQLIKTEKVANTYKDMLKRLRLITKGKFKRATEDYDYQSWDGVTGETRGMWGPSNLIKELERWVN